MCPSRGPERVRAGRPGRLPSVALLVSLSLGGTVEAGCLGAADAGGLEDGVCEEPDGVPQESTLVLTLVLPDGLGDAVFGECTVSELLQGGASVSWLRVYPSGESLKGGERLVGETAALAAAGSAAFATPELFANELRSGKLDRLWAGAREVFLAPWIFGIYAHDRPLLELARRALRHVWALSEYGRGMGNLHSYTDGLASQIPTGWPRQPGLGAAEAGIFKTILRAPASGTDWRGHFASRLGARDERLRRLAAEGGVGLEGRLRLWWAYGRKDSAHAHDFRLAAPAVAGAQPAWPEVVKVVPMREDGGLATGVSPTTGQLLAEQAAALLESPGRPIDLGVAVASETASHVAGQLSELLVHVLTREVPDSEERDAVEVIVAPNAGVEAWAGSNVVRVSSLEMLFPSGERQHITLGRPVFLVAEHVPRREMRTFLEQCEAVVVATGDQSVAEAILLGKIPMVRPDAKVEQWDRALSVAAEGAVEAVPDLGEVMRRLLRSPQERSIMQQRSRERSEEVEARATAELGRSWSAAQETLVRAGMFG